MATSESQRTRSVPVHPGGRAPQRLFGGALEQAEAKAAFPGLYSDLHVNAFKINGRNSFWQIYRYAYVA